MFVLVLVFCGFLSLLLLVLNKYSHIGEKLLQPWLKAALLGTSGPEEDLIMFAQAQAQTFFHAI